jgi:hypothetical protein
MLRTHEYPGAGSVGMFCVSRWQVHRVVADMVAALAAAPAMPVVECPRRWWRFPVAPADRGYGRSPVATRTDDPSLTTSASPASAENAREFATQLSSKTAILNGIVTATLGGRAGRGADLRRSSTNKQTYATPDRCEGVIAHP